MKDYRAIFEAIESTLIREGSRNLPESLVRSRLDEFKQVEGKRFSDAEVYRLLVEIAFYSGFRAATVTEEGFGPRRSRKGRKARKGGPLVVIGFPFVPFALIRVFRGPRFVVQANVEGEG